VRLWRSEQPCRPIAHLAGELSVHPEALRNRIRQDEANGGERDDGAARAVLAAELDASRTR
jgi:transposase